MTRTMLMYDAVPEGVNKIPADAQAVAGYVDGAYRSFPDLLRRFYPHAHCVSIGIFLEALAAFTDVEQGNPVNTPAKVRASFEYRRKHGVWRPGFYGDLGHMHDVILPGLTGIPRNEYRLWLADWTGRAVLIPGFDAVQFTNNARNGREGPYDTSIVDVGAFFPHYHHPVAHPPTHKPPPEPRKTKGIHPKVIGGTGGAGLGVGVVALLQSFGVHVTPAEAASVSTLLTGILGYLSPPAR